MVVHDHGAVAAAARPAARCAGRLLLYPLVGAVSGDRKEGDVSCGWKIEDAYSDWCKSEQNKGVGRLWIGHETDTSPNDLASVLRLRHCEVDAARLCKDGGAGRAAAIATCAVGSHFDTRSQVRLFEATVRLRQALHIQCDVDAAAAVSPLATTLLDFERFISALIGNLERVRATYGSDVESKDVDGVCVAVFVGLVGEAMKMVRVQLEGGGCGARRALERVWLILLHLGAFFCLPFCYSFAM